MLWLLCKDIYTFSWHSSDRFDERRIEVLASQVVLGDPSFSDKLFEDQVVSSSGVVVAICLNALLGEVVLESQFDCLFQNVFIDWYPVIAYDDAH